VNRGGIKNSPQKATGNTLTNISEK